MCYHLHHCVLLLDVRGHMVCYADLRLAHVFQSPGHYASTPVWKDVLLPPGHMVHSVYPYSGYTGYSRGTAAYLFFFFLCVELNAVVVSNSAEHHTGRWRLC